MIVMQNWLSKYKFQAHLTAFLLMVIASIGLLFAMKLDSVALIWLLVAVFAAANVLAIFVK